jgi:hypothetical protein
MSNYFAARLSQMKFKHRVETRIKRLAIGVEFESEDYASNLVDKCHKAGLLLTVEKNVLLLFPALTLDQETAQHGLDSWKGVSELRLARALARMLLGRVICQETTVMLALIIRAALIDSFRKTYDITQQCARSTDECERRATHHRLSLEAGFRKGTDTNE